MGVLAVIVVFPLESRLRATVPSTEGEIVGFTKPTSRYQLDKRRFVAPSLPLGSFFTSFLVEWRPFIPKKFPV